MTAQAAGQVQEWGAFAGSVLVILTLVSFLGGKWLVRQINRGIEAARTEDVRKVVREELSQVEERTRELVTNGGRSIKDIVQRLDERQKGMVERLDRTEYVAEARYTEMWRELATHGIDRRRSDGT